MDEDAPMRQIPHFPLPVALFLHLCCSRCLPRPCLKHALVESLLTRRCILASERRSPESRARHLLQLDRHILSSRRDYHRRELRASASLLRPAARILLHALAL